MIISTCSGLGLLQRSSIIAVLAKSNSFFEITLIKPYRFSNGNYSGPQKKGEYDDIEVGMKVRLIYLSGFLFTPREW